MFGAAPTDAELPGPLDSPDLLRRPHPDDSCQVVLRIFVNDTPRHASAGVHCGLVHLACSHPSHDLRVHVHVHMHAMPLITTSELSLASLDQSWSRCEQSAWKGV